MCTHVGQYFIPPISGTVQYMHLIAVYKEILQKVYNILDGYDEFNNTKHLAGCTPYL